ncbi:MAG: efflux RND transporter periplasmic adaptor subunit [Candidatus Obscuribacterales bacterium]|nr:efflux RND transporter periplasmic adaptor subunit [Candidatus Obscuribacterales bacterium]
MNVKRAMLVALAALTLTSCSQEPAKEGRPPAHVTTTRIDSATVTTASTLIGEMDSRKSIDLYPKVDGYVRAIPVRPGEKIRAGQLIIAIDPTKQEATVAAKRSTVELARADLAKEIGELKSQEADLSAQEAQVQFNDIEYKRYYWLGQRGVVAQATVDSQERDLKVAQAKLKSLKEAIEAQKEVIVRARRRVDETRAEQKEEEAQLSYFSMKAPFDGTIGNIPVKIGDYVAQSTKLTSVSQVKPLEVNVLVPKDDAATLKQGMTMELLDRDGNVAGTSTIFYISPIVDLANQSVQVKGLYPNDGLQFRPDQTLEVRIIISKASGIMVPTESLTFVAGQPFVFVVEQKDGKTVAAQRVVHIADIRDNKATLTDGVKVGETLVVSGVQNLSDGTPVVVDNK